MLLSEAIEFAFQYRPSWVHGKGTTTTRINTAHGLRLLGDIDVSTIKSYHFTKLQQDLTAEGKSPATANRVCAAVHTVLTELHLNDILPTVPTYRRLKEPPTKRGYFSREEATLLLEKAAEMSQQLQDAIQFSLLTGCRLGELIRLSWKNVDFDAGTITFLDTKNSSDHSLPLSAQLLPLMERLYQERIDDKVFHFRDKDQVARQFRLLKQRCRLPIDHRTWHSLRHTAGTWMVEAGVPIRSVMAVLNHRNIETTLRYAKCTDNAKAEALDHINL